MTLKIVAGACERTQSLLILQFIGAIARRIARFNCRARFKECLMTCYWKSLRLLARIILILI
jgi:hypothetical protein